MRKLSLGWKIGLTIGLLFVLAVAALVGARMSVGTYYIPSRAMLPTLKVNDHILANNIAYLATEPKRGDVVVFHAPPSASPDGEERLFVKRVVAIPGDSVRITPGYVVAGGDRYNHQMIKSVLGSNPATDQVRFTSNAVVLNGKTVDSRKLASELGLAKCARIEVHPGVVYLNRKVLEEPYTAEDCDLPYPMPSTDRAWIITTKLGKKNVQSAKIPKGKLLVMGDNRNDSNDSRFWGLLDRKRVTGKAVQITFPLNRAGPIR